jgi:formylglycine-generating enzyme required for sulfatase activity
VSGKRKRVLKRLGAERFPDEYFALQTSRAFDQNRPVPHPVENVSWEDAQEFIKKLNDKEAKGGYVYRLPKEAEWEYACRGGAISEEECSFLFYLDKPTNNLSSQQANFNGTIPFGKGEKGPNLGRPTKVGSYVPNKLGLYDMHGNIWQWCEDLYSPNAKDTRRVIRGGSSGATGTGGTGCEAAIRGAGAPRPGGGFGFRLVRVPSGGE